MTRPPAPPEPATATGEVPWEWMLNMPTVDEWLDSLNPLEDEDERSEVQW